MCCVEAARSCMLGLRQVSASGIGTGLSGPVVRTVEGSSSFLESRTVGNLALDILARHLLHAGIARHDKV